MSVLTKFSRDEMEKRLPSRRGPLKRIAAEGRKTAAKAGTKTGRTTTPLRTRVGRRATAGWVAAKGAGRAFSDRKERNWPKRAGIAAAAAGVVGGATAFLRDPERRGKLVGKALAPVKGAQTPNDETIAERVRSEVFRPQDAPKGSVNINVEEGVVYLRGEVADREQIQRVISTAGAVPGVKRVESLLHPPGEEAPTASNGSRSKVTTGS